MYIDNSVSGNTEIKNGLINLHIVKSGNQGGIGINFTDSLNNVIADNQDLLALDGIDGKNKGFFLLTKNLQYPTNNLPSASASEITIKSE
jgi:hypothetical protein